VGPRAVLDDLEKRNSSWLVGIKSQFVGHPAHSAVIIRYAPPCLLQAVIRRLKVYDVILLTWKHSFNHILLHI